MNEASITKETASVTLLAQHNTAGRGQNDSNIKAFVSDLNFS